MDGLLIAQAIGILVVFLGMIALMITRKIPTMLALPIMAIAFGIIAGVPFMSSSADDATIFTTIIQKVSMKMSDAMASMLFGAMFEEFLAGLYRIDFGDVGTKWGCAFVIEAY